MRPRPELRRLIETLGRSGVTSVIAAGAEVVALGLLHRLSLPLMAAFASVQIVGTTITFTLNKVWVFGAGASGRTLGEGGRSLVVFAGSFVLNTMLPSLATYQLHLAPVVAYLASQLITYACWNYQLNRRWVFPVADCEGSGGQCPNLTPTVVEAAGAK